MYFTGAPARFDFTVPAAELVGYSSVVLHLRPPVGAELELSATVNTVTGACSASASVGQTTAGGGGSWAVWPEIRGADVAAFPKYFSPKVLRFKAPGQL